ncbi:MAG: hypothetical protein ACFFDS_02930 [Candidatus Thorarchaeota archaeon]
MTKRKLAKMSEQNSNIKNSGDNSFSKTNSFVESHIVEISKPGKYQVLGKVLSLKKESILISDGSEEIEVFIPSSFEEEIKEEIYLRIFGIIEIDAEKKKTINAIFIQKLTDFDPETYYKVRELEQSLRKHI